MEWNRPGKYFLRSTCGRFRIAKWLSRGKAMYLLSDGDTTVGWYRKPDEAKDKAEELAK
ncbi:hypothetical protein [Halomonas caseinilytica]|uniref:hypothetical protein n=1 Tax=Halomonas caseinilytica TaxID=438744 RepID=UPI000B228611|nr:hypothetical protein [Halomonas caseinilytica]